MHGVLAAAILVVLCPAPLSLAAADGVQPRTETPSIAGSWQIKPLLVKGAPAPETGGTFQQFGETYVMQDFLVFWARFGEEQTAWGLFSLKNGKVSKILLDNTELTTPDARKLNVKRVPDWSSPSIHAGKRMLYISSLSPEHIYGWDGERLVRVLGAGDTLTVGGVRYRIKRTTVLDVNTAGQALLYYDANKPSANGWVLHDGASFTPLWKEGDALPGQPELHIKNLSSGPGCDFNCVPAARLLADGSVMGAVRVIAGPSAPAPLRLSRVSPGKTEFLWEVSDGRLIAQSLSETRGTRRGSAVSSGASVGKLLAARPDSFVLAVTAVTVSAYHFDLSHWEETRWEQPLLVFSHAGVSQVVGVPKRVFSFTPHPPEKIAWIDVKFDDAIFLARDSPRAFVSVQRSIQTSKLRPMTGTKYTTNASPGLYFFDGQRLNQVAWESALGMDEAAVLKALPSPYHKVLGELYVGAPRARIRLRRVDGPVEGVRVDLPPVGSSGTSWFVPADSTDGKLTQGPRFNLEARMVTAADVLAWNAPDVALVSQEDGYFLLERVSAK